MRCRTHELLKLQGIDPDSIVWAIEEKHLGAMAGNAMSQNVLEMLLEMVVGIISPGSLPGHSDIDAEQTCTVRKTQCKPQVPAESPSPF